MSVLDTFTPIDTTIPDQDLKIEWYSGTGAGGQHRNKHQNSCRITHLPTGNVVTAQTRSRDNSLAQALSAIAAKLTNSKLAEAHSSMASIKQKQLGSGMRGDKMRTYRFQDDQVKDHRTNKSATCTEIMRGHMDKLWRK